MSPNPGRLSSVRVMVVDDSPIFLRTLTTLLSHIPTLTLVATATNGVEALPLIEQTQPHLLILDINMPQMNGWEVLDELRRMNSSAQVIVLSAHLEEKLEQHALNKGAAAYLTKGNAQHLLDTLHVFIDKFLDK